MEYSLICLKNLFELVNLPFTRGYLKEKLLTHPEPDSLLAISDTLAEYKVESLALQMGEDNLDQLPLPCVVQVNKNPYPYFTCLTQVTEDWVEYLDEKGKLIKQARKEFVTLWTGITLVVEKGEHSGEPGYSQRRKEQMIYQFLLYFLGAVGLACILGWDNSTSYSLEAIALFIIKLTGLGISAILLWSEVDKKNAAITQFCGGGEKTDCNSVIDSFSIAGLISLGNLAFGYFLAGTMLLLFSSFSDSAQALLGLLSYSSLAIIPFSLYYQGVKLKKWCRLCLWISGILVVELAVSQFLLPDFAWPALRELGLFSFVFLASVLAWISLKPYLMAQKELYTTKSKLAKVLSNKELFDHFLSKSRQITSNPEGLGILLNGANPKYHILKICNPYCGPCARTHPLLEQLYEAGNIDLQIVFVPGGADEIRLKTIRHLLGIASQGDLEKTRKALDEWYSQEKKEYEAFATNYPLNGELARQESNLKAMQDWAEQEQITHTPTIFINGYELPSTYAVEDLKYVLN
ncbi:Vitamin K epoxide reductase family protein [Algoriphagus ornithinivorans]|uniref:Vitamin K epoxide reductase family protein n=1 Tax=Algoriphagus ornithinivorans TaxID=226506 RepID=A0A1I5EYY1_9BACT|nr:cysteine peptidase family C39 domain-containing protein [Algoriphagus ornithinivorans]SFO16738.1 Vitamin K epoxide reductase family protein [Algoriphagus ornithinivorans]